MSPPRERRAAARAAEAGSGPPSHPAHDLGRLGEALVLARLARHGFTLVGQNLAIDGVELDLVLRRPGTLLVVEVKTRRGSAHPEDSLRPAQRRRLHRAAAALARKLRCQREQTRVVLAAVSMGRDEGAEVCFFGIPI